MAYQTLKNAVQKIVLIIAMQCTMISISSAAVLIGIEPSIIMNEVMPANFSTVVDEDGKYRDWVELYNAAAEPIDLGGWGLSNNDKNPFRWVFPKGTTINPKGYLRVWLSKNDRKTAQSNLHTNFNIDNGDDEIVLSAPNDTLNGITVDFLALPITKPDVSLCRTFNGQMSAWVYCESPTPGVANNSTVATAVLATPVIEQPSGVYASGLAVPIAGPTGAELRYTLDGSEPTTNSLLVNGSTVSINASSTLRVGAFKAGNVPSFAATATYVIDNSGQFVGQRLMFVTMEPNDATVFKAKGLPSDTGWKSYLEMIDENGVLAFKGHMIGSDAGQFGSRSRQKTIPMDIKFSDAVGTKNVKVNTPLFHTKPAVTTFKKLRIRNAGNDHWEAHIRDQFWQFVGREANLVDGAFEPTQVFINGAYYGMMDLREKEDENLIESHYGVDKDTVDYLSDLKSLNGDFALQNFNKVYNFITANDMTVPENYEQANTLLDVENLAQDFAIHLFALNVDWPQKNLHYFGMPTYDGKWRYRLHDFDISSGYSGLSYFNTSPSHNVNARSYCCFQSGNLMTSMLENPQFKALYVNIIADQLNTVLSFGEASKKLTDMSSTMVNYLPNQIMQNGTPTSMAEWEFQIERLRSFISERTPFYEAHTQEYLGLSPRQPVALSVNDPSMGTIKVNTLDLSNRLTAATPVWTGQYYPEYPITVEAKPKPGFTFVQWAGSDGSTSRKIEATIDRPDLSYQAIFEPTTNVLNPEISGEALNYLPRFNNKNKVVPIESVLVSTVSAATGDFILLKLQATDPNGYPLTFSEKKFPSGIDLHPETGMVSGKFNRAGVFNATVTVSNGMTEATLPIQFNVSNNNGDIVDTSDNGGNGTGLTANYFGNSDFTGTPGLTTVELPQVNVGQGTPNVPGFSSSNWAIRWEGFIDVPLSGSYDLKSLIRPDDGVRIWIDDHLVIDNWTTAGTTSTVNLNLTAGEFLPVKIEFYDKSNSASFSLNWKVPGDETYQLMPLGVFYPEKPVAPENLAPVVNMTVPSADTTLLKGAPYELTATATDSDGTITKVEFYNGDILLSTVFTAPYTISGSTQDVPVGVYVITAKAYDDDGAVTMSAPVNITLEANSNLPNVAPTVAMTTPAVDTTLLKGAPYELTATATDSDGTITKVEFYNGDALLSTAFTTPYTISGATEDVPEGVYVITAKAYDDDGAVSRSSPVSVTIASSNNVVPIVVITNPSVDTVLKQGDAYSMTASASDPDGTITKVEFYNGGSLLSTLATAPYTIGGSTANVPTGSYVITVKAYDNSGAVSTSNPVTISVIP